MSSPTAQQTPKSVTTQVIRSARKLAKICSKEFVESDESCDEQPTVLKSEQSTVCADDVQLENDKMPDFSDSDFLLSSDSEHECSMVSAVRKLVSDASQGEQIDLFSLGLTPEEPLQQKKTSKSRAFSKRRASQTAKQSLEPLTKQRKRCFSGEGQQPPEAEAVQEPSKKKTSSRHLISGPNEEYNVFNSHWARKLMCIGEIRVNKRDLPESKPQRKLNDFLRLGLVQMFDYLEIKGSIFGRGVFATESIKAERYVVDFPCRAMSSEDFREMYAKVNSRNRKRIDRQRIHFDIPEKNIDYVFTAFDVSDKKKIPLWNGERVTFFGHLLNHSAKHPNVKPVVKHRVNEAGERVAIVIFRSLRDIKKGEELLWDYTADGVCPHLREKPWIPWCPCRKCEGNCWCRVCKGTELHLAVVY
ncbi:hypothetical protein L596_019515 [Steinernema carpocapsae]|uniref:SET domain-containing protein n=1 Tax=Steinernema carpocapsae TaxID=34508 RepID=A0A4U5MQR2_STECR|nr:hypothetical protein L596_019515 [Steinernema carpocapsae]